MQEFIEKSHPLRYKSASDLAVHNIGWEPCPAGYHYGPRICPYHIIHFVSSGSGLLYMDQQKYQVHSGQAFLIPADKIASYEASEKDPWSYYWIGFMGTHGTGYARQLMTASQGTGVLTLPDVSFYCKTIAEASVFTDNTPSVYFRANSALLSILGRLFADLNFSARQESEASLPEAIRYFLETRYSDKLRLSDVAAYFAIHPNYMTRIFRERFSVSPKQYLNQLKMEKAGSLLLASDASIALISDSLGFEDQLSFSKAFRRYYGQSPTGYRALHRKEIQQTSESVNDYVHYPSEE